MSTKKKWWVKKIGKEWWIGHEHFALGNFFSSWGRAYTEAVRRSSILEATDD